MAAIVVKPACPVLRKKDYEVMNVDLDTCYELVKNFHYAKGGANTATFRHGLFAKGDIFHPLGIAWWIPPTKLAAIKTYPEGDWQKVLALSRLVLVPGLPQNAASFLVGQSIKLIRTEGSWECLVTYADQWQGHTGAIYKATNWEYVGVTAAEDTYINPRTGAMVARKAGPKTRTKQEMFDLGYELVGKFSKHKFRMVLHR